MRILIISRTPWDTANSFGNTFSNLFSGMPKTEIYNICCQGGTCRNTVVKKSFQMTDKSVLKSFLKHGSPVGKVVDTQTPEQNQVDFSDSSLKKIKARRFYFALIGRDLIWKMGRWKKSPELQDFLQKAKPDLIYLPIYNSWYLCDLQQYLIKQLSVPVVGHISDDVYGYASGSPLSPLRWIYLKRTQSKLKNLIAQCSYLEVFAENMQRQYEEMFRKPVYLIGKCVQAEDITETEPVTFQDGQKLRFLYTGNIGSERWKALCTLGECLGSASEDAVLDIYSGTAITEEIRSAMGACSTIHFMGSVSAEEVHRLQRRADVLVHVESFSERAIDSARMSFSTKIVDYMCTGKPILAFGPQEVNSISYLRDHNLAITATSRQELSDVLESLLRGEMDLSEIGNNVLHFLQTERNKAYMQQQMVERMQYMLQG